MNDTIDPRKQRFYVVVNHLLADSQVERESPIPVNDVGDQAHGKALCYPNQETILSQTQIDILRDAVEEYRQSVPDGSGIYEEANPLAAARNQFPGFSPQWNHNTGHIELVKQRARFSIAVVRPHESNEPEIVIETKEDAAEAQKEAIKKAALKPKARTLSKR